MQSKRNRWYIIVFILVFIAAIVGFSGYLWGRTLMNSSLPANISHTAYPHPTASPTPPLNMATAVRLIIPKIGINAPVEPVHVEKNGALGTPIRNQWEGTGWYQDGPVPGQHGSAVIDGHLDRPGGLPAVFWRLHELSVGDLVRVEDANSHKQQFQVTKVAFYAPDNAPTTQIFGNASGTYLNLITCAGQWIPQQHQTSLRLVVYTKLIH